MKAGDLVTYGPNLGPQWKKKNMGIVLEVGVFIKVLFPFERDESPNWYHPDNLEVINASR